MTTRIAVLTTLAFLALTSAALAAPSSQITAPADPAYTFYGFYEDATAVGESVHVEGTATDFPGNADLVCYPGDGNPPHHVLDDVSVTGGQFATTADLTSVLVSCILRAVPHGPTPPPGDAAAFTGPRVLATTLDTNTTTDGKLVDYGYLLSGTRGLFSATEPANFGVSGSRLVDPSTLAPAPKGFAGNVLALYNADIGVHAATRSEIEVDGAAAYTPYGVVHQGGSHPSVPDLPAMSIEFESLDPATGATTIVTREPIVKCLPDSDWASNANNFGTSCTKVVATGVVLERTWAMGADGLTLGVRDEWRSVGSRGHSIDVLYDNQLDANGGPTGGFRFPGTSGFSDYALDATVTVPPGAGTIFYKADAADPDTGGAMPQGALSYSEAPDSVRFTGSDQPSGGAPSWTMGYTRTIPANSSATLSFQLAQATGQPELHAFADAFESQFRQPPAGGTPAQTQTQQTQTQNSVAQVAAAGLKHRRARARWSGRHIVIDTGEVGTCSAGAGSCSFNVLLRVPRRVTIGKARVTVAAGKSKHLTVKLSKRWTKLLVRRKRLKIAVTVTPKSAAKAAKATTRSIRVKAPRRKHRVSQR